MVNKTTSYTFCKSKKNFLNFFPTFSKVHTASKYRKKLYKQRKR